MWIPFCLWYGEPVNCWYLKALFRKTSISGASFLHELIQFAYSECVCKKSFATIITFEWLISFMNWFNMLISHVLLGKACMLHKCYICMTFSLHEPMQYVHSVVLFFEIMHYKYCNWTASFLHELIIPVHSVFVIKFFATIITFE